MFDLVDILKSREDGAAGEARNINSIAFVQTDECKKLISEAYRFEGLEQPEFNTLSDEKVSENTRSESIEVIILELNKSQDIAQDAERLSHLMPNGASVVVIGSEDCISTIRKLKALGIYYLFWPINKNELIDFVLSVNDNRLGNRGLSKKRRAKQVSFVGCKGGVGTTLLCAEMSRVLSDKRNASCVVVDNCYQGGNLDIMLGIEKFEKREIRSGSLASNLDFSSSQSLLKKQNKNLSVLSLTSQDIENVDLKDYTKNVAAFVSEEVNFVLEDLSSTAEMVFSSKELVDISDCIILVISPTISSLREAARQHKEIKELAETKSSPVRIIVVLNYSLPDSCATVSREEVEEFLRRPVDIVVPYMKKLDAHILDKKRVTDYRGQPAKAMENLAALIFGEEMKNSSPFPFGWGG
ncbi:AAA family ATPase [Vibrio sp. LaRot3]|uniref:AAA family ATPase n=1 Tax=Vibrio sp. LaRot3 TaxID=2998829 RepID=UPI0022CE2411|nr:type II secretion system protein Z [Vibrio sp. LaRot3]MDA0148798.1 type II secretion system protein Z [Vibrio sp. LaRot3]